MTQVQMIALAIAVVLIAWMVLLFRRKTATTDARKLADIEEAGYKRTQVSLPDGSHLSYREGPANGDEVVLVPPFGKDADSYNDVLVEMAQNYHVYVLERYGSRDSMAAQGRVCSAEYEAKALEWFVVSVVDRPCILSGADDGAALVAWVAADRPKCARALVLESTQNIIEPASGWLDFNLNKTYGRVECYALCLESSGKPTGTYPAAAGAITGAKAVKVKYCGGLAHDEQPGIFVASFDVLVREVLK